MRSDESFVFNHHAQAPWLSHSLCRIAAIHTSTFRPYQLFHPTSEYAYISRQRLGVALHHAHGLRLAAVLSFHNRDRTSHFQFSFDRLLTEVALHHVLLHLPLMFINIHC